MAFERANEIDVQIERDAGKDPPIME